MCKTKKPKEQAENNSSKKDITSLKSWAATNMVLHRKYLKSGDVKGYQNWSKGVIDLLKATDVYTLAAIHSIIKQTIEKLESEIESSKATDTQL